MKPEQHNVEDLFRSAFQDASLEPPHKEDMWAAIQSAVQSPQKPVIPIFRTNRFKVSIAASVALLLGVLYYAGNTDNSVISEQQASNLPKETESIGTQSNRQNVDRQENTLKNEESNIANQDTKLKSNTKLDLIGKEQIQQEKNTEKINAAATNDINSIEKRDSKKVAVVAVVPTKAEEEKAFVGVRYEIREILPLNAEIIIPYSIEKQPILQLIAVVQPKIEVEKAKLENTFWIGFGGFYNSYKPNLQFNSSDLPSPFVKGKLSSINFSDSTNVAKNMRENMTINAAISLNIDFGKMIGKHWFVRSGVNFSSTSFTVNSPVLELLADPNSTNPTLLGRTKISENTINSSTTAINIPIQIGYQSDKIGFNYFVSGGITTDILLNNSLTNTYAPAVYDFGDYKTLNLSVMGSGGLLYNFTAQFSALVELNYRRSLSSVYDSPHLSSNPQWVGVGVGIRKKF